MEEDRADTNLGPDISDSTEETPNPQTKQPRRRFIGQKTAAARDAARAEQNGESSGPGALQAPKPARAPRTLNQIPPSILFDPSINAAIALLPSNYNFEIHKTIHRIRISNCTNIALQFPEGLLLFAPMISDMITQFCPGTTTLIMGDVTYGACCVDDFTARALGCDMLVHYGHSCLVPMDVTGKDGFRTLYVFVTIGIDAPHLLATVERNFPTGRKIALVGTIQFNSTLQALAPRLRTVGYDVVLPRSSPLSAGEILGCTAPTLYSRKSQAGAKDGVSAKTADADMILYVGDGRFHLESILISSPTLREHTYRYDPYSRRLTHETYEHDDMHSLRRAAIRTARLTLSPSSSPSIAAGENPRTWGIILGTLGRQGNPHTLRLLETHLARAGVPTITMLLSEIMPAKLALMSADVGVWVQIACPRLSIDWGYAFERPLLSPYEALVALGVREGVWEGESEEGTDVEVYPMDFYAKDGLGRTRKADIPDLSSLEIEVK